MNDNIVKNQQSIYKEHFMKHGDTPEGTYNQNKAIQYTRFERLIKQFDLCNNKYSIHDIGCGICDLYKYLQDQNVSCDYSGTEIVEEMATLAKKKYPNLDVYIRDVINNPPEEKYDILVLTGVFNLPGDVPRSDWKKFTRNMIKTMFSMCKVGISFNFLTKHADFYNDLMHYEDPGEILNFCVKNLSRFVQVDHAYPLYEYTVTVYKQEHLQNSYPLLGKYF